MKKKKTFPIDLRRFRYDGTPLTEEYKARYW